MSLNVFLSIALAELFRRWGMSPHGGLALANSLATALEAAGLLWLMRTRLRGLAFARVRKGLTASAASAIGMVVVLLLWLRAAPWDSPWFIGGGGVLLGGITYWLLALLFGAPEAVDLPRMLLNHTEDGAPVPLAGSPQGDDDLRDDQTEDHPDKGF